MEVFWPQLFSSTKQCFFSVIFQPLLPAYHSVFSCKKIGPIRMNPNNNDADQEEDNERPRRPSPDDVVVPPAVDGIHRRTTESAQSQTASTPQQSTPSPTGIYSPHQDYFQCLNQWIWAYQWHRICWEQQQKDMRDRMYWQQMALLNSFGNSQTGFVPPNGGAGLPNGGAGLPNGGAGLPRPVVVPQSGPGHPQIVVNAVGPNNQIDPSWRGFKIAPIWKRGTAEMIDIAILMFVKVFLTYAFFDIFFFLDIKKYQDFIDLDVEMTYETARELLLELAIMELAHRLIACLYEAVMTVRGFQYAGATYGKRFMGLRIVTCEEYILLDTMILVKPAATPTFVKAISRAILKNYSWAFFLPLCFTVFFNKENRAAYDSFNKLMVVEVADPIIRLG